MRGSRRVIPRRTSLARRGGSLLSRTPRQIATTVGPSTQSGHSSAATEHRQLAPKRTSGGGANTEYFLCHRDTVSPINSRAHRRADTPASDLPGARTAGFGGRSDPGRSRLRSARPIRTEDRIRPTHSVVTSVPVVGLNRPSDPVLRVCLPEYPESPFSNACMRRHASSSASYGCHRLARGLPRC